MGVTDAQGQPLSTTEDVAEVWRDFRVRLDRFLSGVPEALAAVIEADPDFAIARATAALQAHLGRLPDRDADVELAAAVDGHAAYEWERSYVYAVSETIERGRWPSLDTWRRHHDEFPTDMLAMAHLMPHLEMSADADLITEAADRIHRTIRVVGEDPALLGHLAMEAAERLDLDEAERLGQHSLELDPVCIVGAHPIAHVRYEAGEHAAGVQWLNEWLPTADQEADYLGHLVWHAALHDLALGNTEMVLDRYRRCGAADTPGRLFDGSSLLWRCQLHGLVPNGSDPVSPPIGKLASTLVSDPPAVAVGYHVALALAAMADAEALDRLADTAAASEVPGCAQMLPDLAHGLSAYVQDEPGVAADHLVRAGRYMDRIGGSLAQREVFEDTLIRALIGAGRLKDAVLRLEQRLDRRPSPSDSAWLAEAT
ncbi:MAG: hypothetical protein R3249_05025 [Nitriliruptorales bacterium]|nr:hypothetical protein [Nitriliruptorales bacterium]